MMRNHSITMSNVAQSPWVAGQVNFDYTSHETQLIRKARRGDMPSFNRLVYTYQERAYRFAYRVLGDAEAAGEATLQAFALAHRHFDAFRGGSLSVWLLSFVARACREQLDGVQSRRFSQPKILRAHSGNKVRSAAPASGNTSRLIPDEQALDDILQQGLAALAFEPRVILVLCDIEGYSYEQIAAITGTRADTVRSRLASARKELTQFLTAHQDRLPAQYWQNAVEQ